MIRWIEQLGLLLQWELKTMITLGAFFVFLFATSLPAAYIFIIHHSLSGAAANDPQFDANLGHR